MKTTLKFDLAFAKFLEAWVDTLNKYREASNFTYFTHYALEIEAGKRYVKLIPVHMDGNKPHSDSRSVGAFIDMTNGDVLKPASWKSPAKHARGNIFSDQHGMEAITNCGFVRYL